MLVFKGRLPHAAEKIFDVRRRKKRDLSDDAIHIHLAAIGMAQVMVEYGSATLIIQPAHRHDAIKASRAQQGSVQLPDIVGGADQQVPSQFGFEQRNLLEKFVGDRFFQVRRLVPVGCQFFEFVDEQHGFVKMTRALHEPLKVGALAILPVSQQRAGTQLDEPPLQDPGDGLDKMGLAGAWRAEKKDRARRHHGMFAGQFGLLQRQDDTFADDLLGRLVFGDGLPGGCLNPAAAEGLDDLNIRNFRDFDLHGFAVFHQVQRRHLAAHIPAQLFGKIPFVFLDFPGKIIEMR